MPVYEENADMRANSHAATEVEGMTCRFIKAATEQKRNIYLCTSGGDYISGDYINHNGGCMTLTEVLWDFAAKIVGEENGLFYIHSVYESHYAFANPYTDRELLSEGSAMLFDYLPKKGGKLRIDYPTQYQDAMRYINDTIAPFLENISCKVVLYADHGTMILPQDTKLEDVHPNEYDCHEDWIRIPLAIISPKMSPRNDERLISLMELNDIAIALLNDEPFYYKEHDHVKIARSEIYNPDFIYIYGEVGQEEKLLAFEGFVFAEGYKLTVNAKGNVFLYRVDDDSTVNDIELKRKLFFRIKNRVTVCDLDVVKIE